VNFIATGMTWRRCADSVTRIGVRLVADERERVGSVEKRELDDIVGDATARADQALDRRESELQASPVERLRIEQERAAARDEEFEALRRKIDPSD
jgi:hypothetical protein